MLLGSPWDNCSGACVKEDIHEYRQLNQIRQQFCNNCINIPSARRKWHFAICIVTILGAFGAGSSGYDSEPGYSLEHVRDMQNEIDRGQLLHPIGLPAYTPIEITGKNFQTLTVRMKAPTFEQWADQYLADGPSR